LEAGLKGTMSIAFSPDSATFATTHSSGNVLVWRLYGTGIRAKVPDVNVADASIPAGATEEQRAYEKGMGIIDQYQTDSLRLDEAEGVFKAMLDASPRSARATAGLARVMLKRSILTSTTFDEAVMKRALALADQAVGFDPSFPDAHALRGWVLRALKDTEGAHVAAGKARKLAPTSSRVQLLVAQLAMEDGELDRAEATLRDVLSRPLPRALAATVLDEFMDVYWKEGDLNAVGQAYRRVIELVPESPWKKGNYADFLLKRGDYNAAIAMARSALDQMRYGVAVHTLASAYCAKGEQLLWDDGDGAGATRAFDNAALTEPSNACAYYGRGACQQHEGVERHDRGQLGEARRAYQKAAALDPGGPLVQKALAALD
jgi:tetratricopeptide (TPR) repeat protein